MTFELLQSCICFSPAATLISVVTTLGNAIFETLYPFQLSCCTLPLRNFFTENSGVYLVTGGNRGLGYYSAKILLQKGYTVYILSRNHKNGETAVKDLINITGNKNCKYFQLDLEDLNSILKFIKYVKDNNIIVNGLINNAGTITNNCMISNHVGHFALTIGLIDSLKLSSTINNQSYIVNVSSVAHLDGSLLLSKDLDNLNKLRNDWSLYTSSKAANALFSITLSRILSKQGIVVSSYAPGIMLSDLWRTKQPKCNNLSISDSDNSSIMNDTEEKNRSIFRNLLSLCIKHPSISAAALTSLSSPRFCQSNLCSPKPQSCHRIKYCNQSFLNFINLLRQYLFSGSSGGYYQQCVCCFVLPIRPSPVLYDNNLQIKLWKKTMEYIQINNIDLYNEINTNKEMEIDSIYNQISLEISPALPCTEIIAVSPYCACFSILC